VDAGWAEWIAWQLEDAGYKVLLQKWDMVVGTHWTVTMQEGMLRSERTVAVVSTAYLASVYGQQEWQAAAQADPQGFARKLVPLRVEDCERPGLLGQIVSFDLFDYPAKTARRHLLDTIETTLAGRAKPPVEPIFPVLHPTPVVPGPTLAGPATPMHRPPYLQQLLAGPAPSFPGTSVPVEPAGDEVGRESGSRWRLTAHRKVTAVAAFAAVLIGVGGYQLFPSPTDRGNRPSAQLSHAQTTPTISATPDWTSSPSPAPLPVSFSVSPPSGSSSATFIASGSGCHEVGDQIDIRWDGKTLQPTAVCTATHHYSESYTPENGRLLWATGPGKDAHLDVTHGPHQIQAVGVDENPYHSDPVTYTVS
ncbi:MULTISPECIES: toll/interleukin-1 receptor domain-containing protein, partial [unclassified Frankia]|uniref:toll/interleukin-1 receptor domain-containing protein n=1 Tax=unclassified Frankia TaxID=2632575 RepID=UPI002AD59A4A